MLNGRYRILRVTGRSMEPTLRNGQWVQTRPLGGRQTKDMRGKIIAFRHPLKAERVYVKRVVGLPGEFVAIRDGNLSVEDVATDEPYVLPSQRARARGANQWVNGPDELFVLGDNRSDSEDSRYFGPISAGSVLGIVWARYWPPAIL